MRWLKRYRMETLLLAPLVIYILGLTVVPVLRAIVMGFQKKGTEEWTLDNYRYLFSRPEFSDAFWNTLIITVVGLSLQIAIGLIVALSLKHITKGKGIFRTLTMIPMGVPTLVSGVTMIYIFATSGYLNELLYDLKLSEVPIDWAAGGFSTLMMIVVADMWKVMPIVVLLLLAGLESISDDVYEAAKVDGATPWQTFWRITLPLLRPSITMALILRAIDAFRIFELPLVLAGRNTPVLSTYAYTEYGTYNNPYTSGAASTILLLMIVAFIFLYMFVVERKGGDVQ
ncbi:carbohydrate ABC transporter permease [Effusibacillus lacus]|uniref:Sugar ABC transporter permease n=1 Tax=Effusibacillus lacus TaxID=1348429 RepID=A0A292YI23_9BACL|nr:sugar ABC transporter permease [Effusibacillus lacus]TCS73600.1 carbohydrate ABC transporter membrane protein 1 (CUT1 family) [Effusibacillus lacus]GAX89508.1 sugar ABC transporter permease [Effusibacillus lacus]